MGNPPRVWRVESLARNICRIEHCISRNGNAEFSSFFVFADAGLASRDIVFSVMQCSIRSSVHPFVRP